MGPRITSLFSQFLIVGAGIGAYHLVSTRDKLPGIESEQPTGPSVAPSAPSSGSQPSGLPPLTIAPNFVRFEAMERRVAALERALANASALAPGIPQVSGRGTAGASPTGSESSPVPTGSALVWTEDQLTGLRSMIKEIEVRKNQENYAGMMRSVLRSAAKTPVSEENETKSIALLVAFQRKIAEIFPDGSGGATPEERARSMVSAQHVRDSLEEEIRKVLPDDVAERILSMVPRYPPRPDPDLPSRPVGDGSSMGDGR